VPTKSLPSLKSAKTVQVQIKPERLVDYEWGKEFVKHVSLLDRVKGRGSVRWSE